MRQCREDTLELGDQERERVMEELCLAECRLGHRSRMCRSDGECVPDVCICLSLIGGSDRADDLHMVYQEFNRAD